MAIEVFSRYELKFGLNTAQYRSVLPEIERRMTPDAYSCDGACYTISNIYYDTPDNRLISAAINHEGAYRFKIRLRTYDTAMETAFLEIKKKFRGLTNKRRTTIRVADAGPMLTDGVFPKQQQFMNMQVTNELYRLGRTLALEPKTVVSYNRRAYFGADGHETDLRITFDNDIRSRRTALDLHSGTWGSPLVPDDFYIMEVKVRRSVPLWVAQLLSKNGVRRIKFSKYGTEYKNYITGGREQISLCAAEGRA